MKPCRAHSGRRRLMVVLLAGLASVSSRHCSAQGTPSPSPAVAAPTSHEIALEARVRQLEALIERMPAPEHVRALEAKLAAVPDPAYVTRLEATVKDLSTQVDRLNRRVESAGTTRETIASTAGDAVSGGVSGVGPGGGRGSGSSGPLTSSERSPEAEMPPPKRTLPVLSNFGDGFNFATDDGEFDLQFHNLTQIDGRAYGQNHAFRAPQDFFVPLELLFFNGRLTRAIRYNVALGDVFGSFDAFYAFLDVKFSDRLQFRFGRQKTPFTYEWYEVPLYGLINIERSMFFDNFGGLSRTGPMMLGTLFDKRLEYNVGLFNSVSPIGPDQFLGLGKFASLISLVDTRPFAQSGNPALEQFHLGGSVFAGDRNSSPATQTFWTVVPTGANAGFGTPFLHLNDNVRETGAQAFWTAHLAYFYQQLSLIGEWEGGFFDDSIAGRPGRSRVPVESFYVQAGYFLTGERVVRRDLVEPRHALDFRSGSFGLGAFELAARYNVLDFGNQIFTSGLADPNLWTDRARTVDLGFNWYWNRYVKFVFDWQHASFGQPVFFEPGKLRAMGDSFLFRFQIYF